MHHLILIASLATIQHLLYASLYFNSTVVNIIRTYHNDFIIISYFNRLLTMALFLKYALIYCTFYPSILGLAIFVYGFHLNAMVYSKLGTITIYYGHELGIKKINQWVTSYPFSLFRHPQYYGCIMQLIGAALCFGFDQKGIRFDIWMTCLYASSLYLFTIQIEKLPMCTNDCKITC